MRRKVSIMNDIRGNRVVVINDVRFKGRRSIKWNEVKEYLMQFIGEFFTIEETADIIYIGKDLPDEYTGSNYTFKLKGTLAKAKANAAQGIPEMIEISEGKSFRVNRDGRHIRNARFGWYRYNSRFALPVYDENGNIERYNIFHASMLVRHAADGKMYLYDILNIKKETSNFLSSK